MRIAVFAYNFPHKKTQDFLFNLYMAGIKISCVIACDPIQLNLPPSSFRIKPKHIDLIHPKDICDKCKYLYFVAPHNSAECERILLEHKIDLGVIAGARILKENIINSCEIGIINFHPGILPYARGLDAIKWSIYNNLLLGVTAHLIDTKIDAGKIIDVQEINLYPDDTIIDISLRIEQLQNKMLVPSINKLFEINDLNDLYPVNTSYECFRPMAPDKEQLLNQILEKRLSNL